MWKQETDAEYFGSGHFGSTVAKMALISPQAARDYLMAGERKPSKAMELGSAWDCLLSYGGHRRAVRPAGMRLNTKEGKEWAAENPGPSMSHSDEELLLKCYARMPHSAINIVRCAVSQQTLRTHMCNVPVQMRADAVRAGVIYDFKLSGISLNAWPAHAIRMGYHIQAGWYRMIAKEVRKTAFDFRFIVTESKSPHRTCIFAPSARWLAFGDSRAENALSILHDAIKSGDWSDQSPTMREMELPEWADGCSVAMDEDGSINLDGE
jgi:ribosomal protein L40E